MAKKKSKGVPPKPLVAPAGPPTNLRPGGPHADAALKKRDEAVRRALREHDIDSEAL